MSNNKFYLILTEDEVEYRFFTKDLAIKDAKQLSIQENKTVYFMECTKVFDVEVNLKETSFEETTEESSDVEPKFKVGDIVKYNFSRYQEGVVTEATPEKIKVEIFDGTWLIDHNHEMFFTLVQRK